MAAPGANLGNTNLTYRRYLKGAIETLNNSTKSRKYARQNVDKWTGDRIETRLHVSRSGAIQPSEDGGAFPTAQNQGHVPMVVSRKFLHGKIQITDGQMAAAAEGPNVAKPGVKAEVTGLMRDIAKYDNLMLWRDGTGLVTTLGTDVSGTTIGVKDARALWDDGVQYEVRDAVTPATKHGDITISRVTGALDANGDAEVVLEAALPAAAVATDGIYWKNSYQRAITGLEAMIDDAATTFQGVNCQTYPRWTSAVLDANAPRPLTPLLFRQMLASMMQKTGSDDPAKVIKVHTSSWQMINVEELYEGQIRLTPDTSVAGSAVASFRSALGRIDIEVDTDAPYGTIFFVDWSNIYRGVQKELGWRPGVKGIFNPSQQNATWEATAIEIAEMYIKARHTSGKITDLSETQAIAF